jgi:hypothetical protein
MYYDFVNKLGVVQNVRTQEKIRIPAEYLTYYSGSPWSWIADRKESEVIYTCNIRYKFTSLNPPPPPSNALFKKWIGFRGDPRIVWNAIPFSFVIDWVLKVGDWLSQFDEGAFPVRLTILDACVSRKFTLSCKFLHKYTPSTAWTSSGGDFTFGEVTQKIYERSVILPSDVMSSNALPQWDNLSLRELALATSLFIANRQK